MDLHPDLIRQLNQLSAALDDGTDLYAIVAVLCDDLVAVIPTFLGLDLHTAVAGVSITVTTMTADTGVAVRASLQLPLAAMGVTTVPSSTLTYYAGTRQAFASLAADVRGAFNLDGQVVVDQHLEPTTSPHRVGTQLDDLSTVNQAVGILIGRGDLTLEQAQAELQRLAGADHRRQLDTARELIAEPQVCE